MALSHSLDIARSSLAVASERSAVVARNISHASDPGASRKIVRLTTEAGNAPRISGVDRSVPEALFGRVLAAQSDAAKSGVVISALDALQVLGDPQSGGTIGSQLASLRSALQTYSVRPSDATMAASVLAQAQDVVTALHEGAATIARVRAMADDDIGVAVGKLNDDLARFAALDAAVTQGSRSGGDVTDELDARDRVMLEIADTMGLTVMRRADQGVALYTGGGIPLYDGLVRPIGLENGPLVAGQPGRVLLIDGMPASGDRALVDVTSGKLAGLLELRDDLANTYASQYDEMARVLVTVFAETDQGTPATLPDAAGLFRIGASSALPTAGSQWMGAASTIAINPRVDPAQGGDIQRLRDGGLAAADAGYVYNAGQHSGYPDRIMQLVDRMAVSVATAPASELPPTGSVMDLAVSSSGWLQGLRKSRGEESDFAEAFLDRASGSLQQVAGINIDDQVMQLLELQKSYQASSKLISTVDTMFDALLQAVG